MTDHHTPITWDNEGVDYALCASEPTGWWGPIDRWDRPHWDASLDRKPPDPRPSPPPRPVPPERPQPPGGPGPVPGILRPRAGAAVTWVTTVAYRRHLA